MAHVLANEWCRKMQYLYDYQQSNPSEAIAWTEVVHKFPIDHQYEQQVQAARNADVTKRVDLIREVMPQ